jgi:GNAT superfamily N-acetyltransferase
MTLRIATRADADEIWRVRYLVTENRLTPGRLDHALLYPYLEDWGRGWVLDLGGGRIAGFSIGDARDGNIWALFVDPACAGQGHGRRLHAVMVDWLFAQGLTQLNLGTQPDSRAEGFYRRAGWQPVDGALDSHGDKRFTLNKEDWPPHA